MDEARAVLGRLERIEKLERSGAAAPELLGELRALVREAEEWARVDGDERARAAVESCADSLASEMIAM
jgi:transposase